MIIGAGVVGTAIARTLARSRPARLMPGRPVHLGAAWLTRADPAGGPIRVITA